MDIYQHRLSAAHSTGPCRPPTSQLPPVYPGLHCAQSQELSPYVWQLGTSWHGTQVAPSSCQLLMHRAQSQVLSAVYAAHTS